MMTLELPFVPSEGEVALTVSAQSAASSKVMTTLGPPGRAGAFIVSSNSSSSSSSGLGGSSVSERTASRWPLSTATWSGVWPAA